MEGLHPHDGDDRGGPSAAFRSVTLGLGSPSPGSGREWGSAGGGACCDAAAGRCCGVEARAGLVGGRVEWTIALGIGLIVASVLGLWVVGAVV